MLNRSDEVAQASHSFADWGILADGAIRLRGEAAGKDDQRLGLAGQAQIEFLEGLDVIRLGEKGQQDGEAFGDAVYAFGGLKGVEEFNNKLKLLGAFRDGKEMDELQVIRKKLPMRFAVPAGRRQWQPQSQLVTLTIGPKPTSFWNCPLVVGDEV